jgi:hypothetical protein
LTQAYAHALQRPDTEAADKLDKLFNKNENNELSK